MRTKGNRGYEGGRGEGVWGMVAEREAGATGSRQGMKERVWGWEKNKSKRGSQDHPGGMRAGLSDIHCGVGRRGETGRRSREIEERMKVTWVGPTEK
jgi:hypothetical protein